MDLAVDVLIGAVKQVVIALQDMKIAHKRSKVLEQQLAACEASLTANSEALNQPARKADQRVVAAMNTFNSQIQATKSVVMEIKALYARTGKLARLKQMAKAGHAREQISEHSKLIRDGHHTFLLIIGNVLQLTDLHQRYEVSESAASVTAAAAAAPSDVKVASTETKDPPSAPPVPANVQFPDEERADTDELLKALQSDGEVLHPDELAAFQSLSAFSMYGFCAYVLTRHRRRVSYSVLICRLLMYACRRCGCSDTTPESILAGSICLRPAG